MQTRLDQYFKTSQLSASHRCFLLDILSSIRTQVYSLFVQSSAYSGRHFHLNFADSERPLFHKTRRVPDCDCRDCLENERYNPLPPLVSLLLTCRKIYRELSLLIYSSYAFKISQAAPRGLSCLFKLGTVAIDALAILNITLCEEHTTCTKGEYACLEYDERCTGDTCYYLRDSYPNGALGCSSRNDKMSIDLWRKACSHLAKYMRPASLQLGFVCDVDGIETARRVLEPMHQLPVLAGCSIRLSPRFSRELQDLADQTTSQLTKKDLDCAKSRSDRHIPHDIQTLILEYTDLVAPQDLQWSPQFGFSCHAGGLYKSPDFYENPCFEVADPCQICIGTHRACSNRRKLEHHSSSSHCRSCWQYPKSLFLLSHELRLEAIRIFCSRNHFCIEMSSDGKTAASHWLSFLKGIPGEGIKYLRSIQFVVTDLSGLNDLYKGKFCEEWASCVQLLMDRADAPWLDITVDNSKPSASYDYTNPDRSCLPTEKMVETLKRIRGLHDFFVHLRHPLWYERRTNTTSAQERAMEEQVMGKGYHSDTRGKFDVPGRWFLSDEGIYY